MQRGEALAVLAAAPRSIALLARVNPTNFEPEVDRVAALADGQRCELAFEYAHELTGLARARATLEEARACFDREADALYRERAEELILEARLAEARGTPAFRVLAAERFASSTQCDELADAWIDAPPAVASEADPEACVLTDDASDERSLLNALRRALSVARLPVRVIVSKNLIPLAAAGDGFLQIAAARRVSVLDVERTVLHELEGHIRPMLRARSSPHEIARVGSARGSDTQEGVALHLEQRGSFLGGARATELGLRHRAGGMAHAGASFAETVHALAGRAPRGAVVRAACRAFRGGGLGREVAYLPAYVELERRLSAEPDVIERLLEAGRVSLDALERLERPRG